MSTETIRDLFWRAHRRQVEDEVPRLSRREREILELLVAGGEMAGLDLIAASSCLGRGMVYVSLLRLADKGLVDSRPAPGRRVNGHGAELPRRLFRATGAAPAALAAARGPALQVSPPAPEGALKGTPS